MVSHGVRISGLAFSAADFLFDFIEVFFKILKSGCRVEELQLEHVERIETALAFLLKALFIPRFVCPQCRRTCSRLPACLAPLRQYRWKVQASVLDRLLGGASMREVAQTCSPSRRTVGRWWHWLKEHFAEHSFHLRSRFAELVRAVNFCHFWRTCLEHMALEEAMGWLEHEGVAVP